MALIKCVKCTEQYSDTLSACPHCGFIPRIFVCPECNGLYGDGSAACSSCGYVLPGGGKIPATQEVIGRELEHTITVIKEATTSEQLVKIQEKLKLFSMQEDVSEILAEYEKKLSGILSQEQQEALYAFAVDSFSQKRSNAELQELIGKLEALGDYKDAKKYAMSYREKLSEQVYQEAVALSQTAKTQKDWQAALELFSSVSDYKDAIDQIRFCETNRNTVLAARKKKTMRVGVVACIMAVVVLAAVVTLNYFIPNHFYQNGIKLFEEEQYSAAAEAFASAGNYKDAPQRAEEAVLAEHYTLGIAALDEKEYEKAIEEFSQAGSYSDAKTNCKKAYYQLGLVLLEKKEYVSAAEALKNADDYEGATNRIIQIGQGLLGEQNYSVAIQIFSMVDTAQATELSAYANGMICFNNGEYSNAIAYFNKAESVEGAQEKGKESNYLCGIQKMAEKQYEDAKQYFQASEDYGYAKDLISACSAEEALKKGRLDKALELYATVPNNIVVDGYNTAERSAMLNRVRAIGMACGNWKASENYIESRNVWNYDGRWEGWYIDEPLVDQTLTFDCFVNDDGTVTIKGEVSFYRYTSYSSLARYCNASKTSKSFTIENVTVIPASYAIDGNTNLIYSNGVFRLEYSVRDDYSTNFHNFYNSTVTYRDKL